MVDPVTTNRGFAQPLRGNDSGTWDVPVNGNMSLLDTILGGYTSISSTGGTTTLNASQLAGGTISVSGAMASNITLLFPAVQGWWSIENLTTNNNSFAVLVACGTGATVIGIPPGEVVDIQINGNTPKYRNLGRVGSYLTLATSTVPPWITQSTVQPYLNCDGTTFSAVTYPYLNAYLGGTSLPDARGRLVATLNQTTNRMTTAGGGVNGDTLLAAGGFDTHTLTVGQIPTGLVGNNSNNFAISVSGGGSTIPLANSNVLNIAVTNVGGQNVPYSNGGTWTGAGSLSGTVGSGSVNIQITNSGGQAHSIMQPTVVGGLTLIRAA